MKITTLGWELVSIITSEKAIGTGWTITPLRRKRAVQEEQLWHLYNCWLSMTIFMYSFNLHCLNDFKKSIDIDDLIVNFETCLILVWNNHQSKSWVYLKVRGILCPSNISCVSNIFFYMMVLHKAAYLQMDTQTTQII